MSAETCPEIIIGGERYIRLYHFMPAKYLYDMLAKDEVKIAIPEECNDPLEFMPAGDASEGDNCRPPGAFVSFSAQCTSSLMWAHYADAHKGVCLEFTIPLVCGIGKLSHWQKESHELVDTKTRYALLKLPEKFLGQFEKADGVAEKYVSYVVEVDYQDKRPSADIFAGGLGGCDGMVEDLYLSPEFFTKSSEWSYEEEWRLMVYPGKAMSSHDGFFFIRGITPYISKIILGKRFPQSTDLAWWHILHSLSKNNERQSIIESLPWAYPNLTRAYYDEEMYKMGNS